MFYGYGRELKRVCPHDPNSAMARDFLLSSVEEYKKVFPNLALDHPSIANMKIEVGTLKLNPNAFIVRNVRDGFRKRVQKRH